MPDLIAILYVSLVFALAGAVKGVLGLGLPTVSLGLLVIMFDLPAAMLLIVGPSLVTNAWQAFAGPNLSIILRRIWPFLLMAVLAVFAGSMLFTLVDDKIWSVVLGALLVLYALLSLSGWQVRFPPGYPGTTAVLMGTLNGLLTGVTGSFVFPGVLYLQTLGLSRNDFIKAMGLLFCGSTLTLGVVMNNHPVGSNTLWGLSIGAIVPALAGMWCGIKVRQRLRDVVFKNLFFLGIAILGIFIIVRDTL